MVSVNLTVILCEVDKPGAFNTSNLVTFVVTVTLIKLDITLLHDKVVFGNVIQIINLKIKLKHSQKLTHINVHLHEKILPPKMQ